MEVAGINATPRPFYLRESDQVPLLHEAGRTPCRKTKILPGVSTVQLPLSAYRAHMEKLENQVTINHNILPVKVFSLYIFRTVHRSIHMGERTKCTHFSH
jgi:hypothetical protein